MKVEWPYPQAVDVRKEGTTNKAAWATQGKNRVFCDFQPELDQVIHLRTLKKRVPNDKITK